MSPPLMYAMTRPVPPPLPQEMRALFTRLRQSCCHPQLVKEREELHGRGLLSLAEIMANLVKEGAISESIAYDRSSNEEDLRNHLHQ